MACENTTHISNVTLNELGSNCSGPISYNGAAFAADDEGLYQVPTGIIILLSLFYGTISITAVVGNSTVIWIIVTNKRMHNITYYFIANLALADIIIGLFSIPFQFQAALLQRWNLPHFMCPFCPFIQMLSVSVSIFTLTAIAVDRHRAVLKPLSARPSKFKAKIVIAVIWCLGALLGLPMALALRVTVLKEFDRSGRVHYRPFCHNTNFSDSTMMYYRCIMFMVQYVIPLCIISGAYVRMAQRLWDARAPGNAEGTRDANFLKNKKKVIKMMIIVVSLFALCWLPLQTYNFLQEIIPDINRYRYINIIWFSFDWLAMSNSCYNPFIYGIYNNKAIGKNGEGAGKESDHLFYVIDLPIFTIGNYFLVTLMPCIKLVQFKKPKLFRNQRRGNQEKFKREFQLRFPAFRLRQRSPTTTYSESIDMDKTGQSTMHSRVSVKYSHHDLDNWSRKFSTTSQSEQRVNFRYCSSRKSPLPSRHSAGGNYFDLREMGYHSKSVKNKSFVRVSEFSPVRSSKSDEDDDDVMDERGKNCRNVLCPLFGSKEQLFDNDDVSSQAASDSAKMDNTL